MTAAIVIVLGAVALVVVLRGVVAAEGAVLAALEAELEQLRARNAALEAELEQLRRSRARKRRFT